jgi:hypothetical protein
VALVDRPAARCRALVQDHVPERVLAAGHVSTAASAGFPPASWIGVTPNRVYAFAAEDGKVGELIGAWDRTDLTVTTSVKVAATRLSLRVGAADGVTADARRWRAGTRRLVRYLRDPARR